MFFFIGGVQPRTVTLDEPSRRCDACGLHRVKCMRTDHYLSLFFVPLLPVKRGEVYFRCESCGTVAGGSKSARDVSLRETCPECGRDLDHDFRFCPSCGHHLNA